MVKSTFYKKVLRELESLQAKYPKYSLGKHLSTALDGCDLWAMSDKQMYDEIVKYSARMEYDIHPEEGADVDKIIKDGLNLGLLREGLYDTEED